MESIPRTARHTLSRRGFLVGSAALTATAFAALAGCSPSEQTAGGSEQAVNPVPEVMATDANPQVIVVSGSNDEMGYQYGIQAADLIFRNINLLKSKIVAQYGEELTKTDMQVWSYYADKHDPGLRGWLEGIQRGLKDSGYTVDYLDVLLVTVYSGEMWCRPPVDQPYPEETGIKLPETSAESARTDIHSCTAFAAEGASTPDGKPIVGVTKMITAEKVNSVVLVAFPSEGNAFVSNPMAGSVSENAGLNSAGFSWVFTAQWGEPIWGVVNEVSFHNMVQNCNSPDEAVSFLESVPRAGVTGAFVLTSANGGITGYESLSNVSATRVPGDCGEGGEFIVQTNHLVNPDLQDYNAPASEEHSSQDRYATMEANLENAANNGGITVEAAKAAFSSDDWLDSVTGEWTYNDPGSPSVNDNTESMAQSVFLPAEMKAYFEVGTPNGVGLPGNATGEYIELTLGEDPLSVSNEADLASQGYYWDARNAFVKLQNADAPELTEDAEEAIRELLDVAATELEYGMDRAGFAFQAPSNGQDVIEEMQLWGAALTHFTKSQLYSQMAMTQIEEL